ncbi:MAG: hypothetical protein M3416_21925 [Acidobacteriota bacterium]|nr:hypothetical protein [Acidobacteriota bacterium]
MSRFTSPLDRVRVAAPCRADWDSMLGDERVRFCHQCERSVYNLSGMSKRDAEALVAGAEGRLCVRFYRRADGSILTDNCPVGLRAVRQRVARASRAAVSAALGLFAGLGLAPAPRVERTVGAVALDPEPPRSDVTIVEPAPVASNSEPRQEDKFQIMGVMIAETEREKQKMQRRGRREK